MASRLRGNDKRRYGNESVGIWVGNSSLRKLAPYSREMVAKGTPEKVAKNARSFTGRYLAPLLGMEAVTAE